MRQSTLVRGGFESLRRGWRGLQPRWRIAALVAGFLITGVGTIPISRWWTEWPARLILPTARWSRPSAFSPDGSTLATASWGTREELAFWDPATGRKRSSLATSDRRYWFVGRFSPDGRTFASPWQINSSGRNISVDLVDPTTGRVRSTFPLPDDGLLVGLSFRDGGAKIRLTSANTIASTLATTDVDVPTGRARPSRTLGCPMPWSYMGVSDDGRYLAFTPMAGAAAGPTNVTVWDLDEDREALKLPPIPARMIAYAIEFSPDGGTLALGFEDGSIQLWDLAARRLRTTLPRSRENYSPLILNFSPDGSTLASFNHFSNRVVSLDLARMLIAAHLGDVDHTMQSELVLFDVATGRPRISTPWEGIAVFSPDGRSVATIDDDNRIRIHDLRARPTRPGGR